MTSPYIDADESKWLDITRELVEKHPLSTEELVDVVLSTWESIFNSSLGTAQFHIGEDIFPKPQIMGFFLHELIPLELTARYPKQWRGEKVAADKDVVYEPDSTYSIEIKTSSNPKHIFGNRSYAQATTDGKKSKDGYYLTVNFEKFSSSKNKPSIKLIRFGWLDAEDWIGQKASTGQQARLPPLVYQTKLLCLHELD